MEIGNTFKVRVGDIELELTGDSQIIANAFDRLPDILASLRQPISQASGRTEKPSSAATDMASNITERHPVATEKTKSLVEFLKSKGAKNNQEQAACIAYYMEKFEGINVFGSKEIAERWKMSKLPVPNNISDAISRACQKSYITQISNNSPFQYRLTNSGEHLVEVLQPTDDVQPVKPRRRTGQPSAKRLQEASHIKTILEAPFEDIRTRYPDVHTIQSVIAEICWVLLVCRNEFGLNELEVSEVQQILSQKLSIRRSEATIASALRRNPRALDRVGRGKYRLMKIGEDMVLGHDQRPDN